MLIGERVAERLKLSGLSQAELARRVGVSQQAIGKLISGASRSTSHLHRIARELNTSPSFLEGATDDPEEGAIAPPSPQSVADQLDAVMIPQVEVSYSMGGGSVIDEWPVVRMVPVSLSWLRLFTSAAPSDIIIAQGDGDSMEPTIHDRDLVFIDRSKRTMDRQDRIWALAYGGFGMIKRLRMLADGQLQINSDNQSVSPIVAADDEAFLVGRVVALVRRI